MSKKQTIQEKLAKKIARAITSTFTDAVVNSMFEAVKKEKLKQINKNN